MNIAIEISWAHKSGGARTYAKALVRALLKQSPDHAFIIIANTFLPELNGIRQIVLPCPKLIPQSVWDHIIIPFFLLPYILRREKVDLIHFTNNIACWKIPCKSVVTIHDLLPFANPAWTRLLHRIYLKFVINNFSRHCEQIITDTQFSASEIQNRLAIPSNRITVIPLGAPAWSSATISQETMLQSRAKYALPPRYVLAVGSINQKKNLPNLARAFRMLLQRNTAFQDLKLVLVGRPSWGGTGVLQKIEKILPMQNLMLLHEVPDADIPAIYLQALCSAHVSWYEGFGLPLLESMVCGVPVVASRIPPFMELCDQSALFADPANPDEIAKALHLACFDSAQREMLISKAKARCMQFSWAQVAQQTWSVYQKFA